ncbi:MAG: sulfatase-like hydrolase/transferase, partial [Psychrosphaera sp.]|nr:sulfatase-like hydrolase/transferase [Psychrosphaera sp.]
DGSTAVLSSTTNQDTTFVADLAGTYVASLTVSDAELISNADTVEIIVSPINSAPTGSVSISGTTESGEILTASHTLADENGLGSLNYQWLRSQIDIDGATSTTYTLADSDVGNTIAVKISYTDGDNFAESVTSDETTAIIAAVSAGKPNILLIIADDQGLDASAQYSYSSDLPSTPNIDALAAAGITFDNAWATPQCTTTRGTMITGQHGVNSGISFVPAVMDTSTQTLQRYLKAQSNSADYQTAVIGKWHLGGTNPDLSHPTDSGVDYYAGTITGTLDDYYNWELTENGQSTTSTDYHTTKITDLAISWLDTQNQANTPWFLWMAYVAPHSPFHLPPESLHNRNDLIGTTAHIEANKRDYYLAALEAMDSEIGRLIDSLPAKEREHTLIVYIGDNGTPAAVIATAVYDRSHSKSSLYEGGIRIPMVVSGNGVTRTNQRETALVNTADFYATFTNFTGSSATRLNDSYSFLSLLSSTGSGLRSYNYSEFESDDVSGWTVRNQDHKLIEYTDGTQELYKVSEDLNETTNLASDSSNASLISELQTQGKTIRGETSTNPLDITNATLTNRSANCADYVESYQSTVNDVNNGQIFNGALTVSLSNEKCVFSTNNIPNHDFNDGSQSFPNNVSAQDVTLEVTASPAHAASTTSVTLRTDNAVMLNGVKVDLLAAACFGVGNGKIGCNDINQPWRYDPMFVANGFRVDTHNAHSQANGSYHYHGTPNALFDGDTNAVESPVIGFAADGYPIFGSYFDDNGTIRKALSSFSLINGSRPSGNDDPGGTYDGTYRDDYEYVSGNGDLDECNGMTVDGVYGYYVTDGYPYILACFKGTVDASFDK